MSATRLRWDVDPLAWVRHHWTRAGWTIAVARPLDARWHPRFEVGALRRTEGTVELRRTVGLVDNGRLLRVDTVAPSSSWSRMHDALWPCGVLFCLERPTFRREVEAQHRVGRSDRLAFELPASWQSRRARPPWPRLERWVSSPTDGAGRAALRVETSGFSGELVEPIEARQHRLRHELWDQARIRLARRFERVHAGLAAGTMGLAGVFRAEAVDDEERFEVRLAHRLVDGVFVDYAAVVASPEAHPIESMRASRALEIAVASTEIRSAEEVEHAA